MKYYKCAAKLGDKSYRYLVEAHDLLSVDEAETSVAKCAVYLALDTSEDVDELLSASVECDTQEIGEDEFVSRVLDFAHVRLADSLARFSNSTDMLLNVYQVCKDDISEEPFYVQFSADCGQDAKVDYVNMVTSEFPYEQVREEGWRDCMYQFNRYFHVSGMDMLRGTFEAFRLTQSDYEYIYDERKKRMVV